MLYEITNQDLTLITGHGSKKPTWANIVQLPCHGCFATQWYYGIFCCKWA